MMTAEQLKASILQLAMQGKLVEQRPEEGTGEELYKEIQIDKKKLIKDGSIKAGKKYNAISEEEIMFDIPDTWVWTRLSDIVFNRGQKKPENAFSYIDIGSIDNVHQRLNDEENIIEAENAPSRARKIVAVGDVIYSTVRPYLHNMCIIDREFSHEPIASTGFAAMTCHKGLYNRFLFYYLFSPDFDRYANDTENSKGVAYPAINDQKLYKALVPLPPLAEQKRIVSKIEELMPFVEQYAAVSTKLSVLNVTFPEMMKKSILQEAVQGKLVPQDPNDEPASLLLKKIAEEKKRLIREGKIKKQKPLLEITEDEIPFEIPESWEWVRIGEIFKVGTGMTPLKGNSLLYDGGTIPWITSSLTSERYITQADSFVTQYAVENTTLTVYPAHSLIIAMYGQGKTRGQVSELLINATTNQACAVLEYYLYYSELIEYTYYYFMFNYDVLRKKAEGTSQPNLNLKKIAETIIPIPPLNEQRRIVAKTKEIIYGIDTLSSKL